MKKSEDILRKNVDKLHSVAKYLIEHETMTGEDFDSMMKGETPGDKDEGIDIDGGEKKVAEDEVEVSGGEGGESGEKTRK